MILRLTKSSLKAKIFHLCRHLGSNIDVTDMNKMHQKIWYVKQNKMYY